MKRVLAVFLVLLTLPVAMANPMKVLYSVSKAYPQDALYSEGRLYLTVTWNDSPFLLVLFPNGSVERVVKYTVPEGSIFPRTIAEFNGTLMIAGSFTLNSSRELFLMATSMNGSVLWARSYDVEGSIYDIIPSNKSLLLIGDDGKSLIVLEVSTNGSVIRGFKYDSRVMSLWEPKAVRDGNGLVICGNALKYTRSGQMAFLLRIDEKWNVEWAKTYREFQKSACNEIEVSDEKILSVIQSKGRIVLVNVGRDGKLSISRAIDIPTERVSRFSLVKTIGHDIILIGTSPPGYLLIDPRSEATFVSFAKIEDGKTITATANNDSIYFAGISGEYWKLFFLTTSVDLPPGYPFNVTKAVPISPEAKFYDERIKAFKLRVGATSLNITTELASWKPESLERWYRITVGSTPKNATLWIDGIQDGNTPTTLYLRPGIHTVYLKRREYLPANKTLNVSGEMEISFNLTPLNGTLRVSSNVDKSVLWIDGRPVGEIEGTLTQEVTPGPHKVRITKSNYTAFERIVNIEPNESVEIYAELSPIPAILTVKTPGNLSIYINGTYRGKSPASLTLSPGVYLVNVTDGDRWNATTVTLKPNETVSLELSLPAGKSPSSSLPLVLVFMVLLGAGVYAYFRGKPKAEVSTTKTDECVEVKVDRSFGLSHVGARDNNEDNLLILKLPDAYLLAVADGLGGHNAGEVASQIAVETLREVFGQEYRKGLDNENVKRLLEKAHKLAHERIQKNAIGEREGMGTTLVTAFVRNGKVTISNTGDSRAYLIRTGSVAARTKDHSIVQELLDKGEITSEEAKSHPMKNIITKALGIDFGIDLYEWELKKGDILLLSSDGLHDYVDEEKIVEIASQGGNAEEIARRLVEEALPVTKDNVTVVVRK